MYAPEDVNQNAELNFHLTAAERNDVIGSFNSTYNKRLTNELLEHLH
jgi:hypothetical protein